MFGIFAFDFMEYVLQKSSILPDLATTQYLHSFYQDDATSTSTEKEATM